MNIKKVNSAKELELDDVVIIVRTELDVDNDTEVGCKEDRDFSRIYLHEHDIYEYLSNGDILFVTGKNDREVECITIDKECYFNFPIKGEWKDNQEIVCYKVVVDKEVEHEANYS